MLLKTLTNITIALSPMCAQRLAEQAVDIRLRQGDHLVTRMAVYDFRPANSHQNVQARVVGRDIISRPRGACERRFLPAYRESPIGFAAIHS